MSPSLPPILLLTTLGSGIRQREHAEKAVKAMDDATFQRGKNARLGQFGLAMTINSSVRHFPPALLNMNGKRRAET